MKFLIRLLKNRRLLLAFIFILLILAVLIAGLFWDTLTWERQIFAIIIILFLWILAMMYERLLAVREAGMLEQAIKSQAQEQLLGMRPDRRAEIEQLQQQFLAAIESLKKTKLGKRRSGKAALYALPWYMFIGPPAAGKTTAIVHSGLEFPIGADSIKGIGGTRNCDWFFSNSAIILDTAGRYVTEEDDKEEWVAFLQMLKKYRRQQPINGVVVGISVDELVKMNDEELEFNAGVIRKRINELMQELGVRFPVYLIFTKCDLLQGFVEFFEVFERREREQIWGCTLIREQQDAADPGAVFEEEFHRLVEVLIQRRLSRLSAPMKRESRQRVYVFPLQFASIGKNLRSFVSKLFQPNPYQDRLLFRGFYFTSGTQEGVPIDRVIQKLAEQYHLPPGAIDAGVEIERKSYFIKDLFNEVIIPDQNALQPTSLREKQKGWLRIGVFAAAILLLTLFIISVTHAYIRSSADLEKFEQMALVLTSTESGGPYPESYFQEMERLSSQMDGIQGPFWGWNIYQGDKIKRVARQLFYRKLKPFVENELYRGEIARSLSGYNRYRGSEEARQQMISHLKAYLLLGDSYQRLQDSEDAKFLKDHLASAALERLGSGGENQNIAPLVKRQMELFVDIVVEEKFKPFQNDPSLIEQARSDLIEKPSIQGLYAQLKVDLKNKAQPFTLAQALSGQYGDYFQCDYEIPGIFTKAAWNSSVKEGIDKLSENPVTDDWVLGQKQNLRDQLGNKGKIEQELKELYYREYIDHWWKFLRSIHFQPFSGISEAAQRFKMLSEIGASPLVLIIEAAAGQTQLEGRLVGTVRDRAGSLGDMLSEHPVDRQFASLHELTAAGPLGEVLIKFLDVSIVLEKLAKEEEGEVAKYAQRVLDNSEELSTALKTVKSGPRFDLVARQNLFEEPLTMAWQTILNTAQGYLNSAWERQVYEQYKKMLESYYPFNEQESRDASIDDIVTFFNGSDGILEAFLQEELSPFVDSRNFRARTWEGKGLQLSGTAISALRKAKEIARGLGIDNSNLIRIGFSLLPELPEPRGFINQITLIIDGKDFSYRMGRQQWEDFTWPGDGVPGARIEVFVKENVNVSLFEKHGKWAWFRLLKHADIERITASEFWLHFRYLSPQGGQLTINYKLRANSSRNPFSSRSFFDFKCPRQLN